MGVDLQTYRAKIGTFRHSVGLDVVTIVCCVNFTGGLKTVGAVLFVGILLLIAGIESNPGPNDEDTLQIRQRNLQGKPMSEMHAVEASRVGSIHTFSEELIEKSLTEGDWKHVVKETIKRVCSLIWTHISSLARNKITITILGTTIIITLFYTNTVLKLVCILVFGIILVFGVVVFYAVTGRKSISDCTYKAIRLLAAFRLFIGRGNDEEKTLASKRSLELSFEHNTETEEETIEESMTEADLFQKPVPQNKPVHIASDETDTVSKIRAESSFASSTETDEENLLETDPLKLSGSGIDKETYEETMTEGDLFQKPVSPNKPIHVASNEIDTVHKIRAESSFAKSTENHEATLLETDLDADLFRKPVSQNEEQIHTSSHETDAVVIYSRQNANKGKDETLLVKGNGIDKETHEDTVAERSLFQKSVYQSSKPMYIASNETDTVSKIRAETSLAKFTKTEKETLLKTDTEADLFRKPASQNDKQKHISSNETGAVSEFRAETSLAKSTKTEEETLLKTDTEANLFRKPASQNDEQMHISSNETGAVETQSLETIRDDTQDQKTATDEARIHLHPPLDENITNEAMAAGGVGQTSDIKEDHQEKDSDKRNIVCSSPPNVQNGRQEAMATEGLNEISDKANHDIKQDHQEKARGEEILIESSSPHDEKIRHEAHVSGEEKPETSNSLTTIKITGLPENIDEEVLEYCIEEAVGPGLLKVKHITLNAVVKMAIVEFEEPEAVERILKPGKIIIMETLVTAEPYDGAIEEEKHNSSTIKVSRLPENVTTGILKKVFENKKKQGGGKVKTVTFDEEKKYAIVEFEEPEAVDIVLKKNPVVIMGKELVIEPFCKIRREKPDKTSDDTFHSSKENHKITSKAEEALKQSSSQHDGNDRQEVLKTARARETKDDTILDIKQDHQENGQCKEALIDLSKPCDEHDSLKAMATGEDGADAYKAAEIVKIIHRHGLEHCYETKLTLTEVLAIDAEEIEHVQRSPKDLPILLLKQLLAANSSALDLRIYHLDSHANKRSTSTEDCITDMFETLKNDDSTSPLDLFLLVFQACDPQLKQLLCQKLVLCKLAVPFLYHDCFLK